MSDFMHGQKVDALYLASSGSYVSEEGMEVFWETVSADSQPISVEVYEPWVRWENPDGTISIVNLRHVERVVLVPFEEPKP